MVQWTLRDCAQRPRLRRGSGVDFYHDSRLPKAKWNFSFYLFNLAITNIFNVIRGYLRRVVSSLFIYFCISFSCWLLTQNFNSVGLIPVDFITNLATESGEGRHSRGGLLIRSKYLRTHSLRHPEALARIFPSYSHSQVSLVRLSSPWESMP